MKKHYRLSKILLTIALCFSMVLTNFGSPAETAKAASVGFTKDDFLKTNGTTIRNLSGQGEAVYLRGTNAGGWLVQESWMNPSNARDQKTIMNTFSQRFGNTVRDQLLGVYEDNYWTEQDFDNCAEMGMSVIRLPFTYMNLCDDNGNLKSNAFERLDWFVENCNERGIYVILDLHGTFGSQNGMDHSGEVNDGYQLYWNDYNRSKTIWLWEQIASHYNGNPAVAGYDILNEPGIKAATTYDLHWKLYDEIYDAIRKVDSDHIIIMESCWGTDNLPNPATYGWENVVYEYHHYPWNAVSDYNGQVSACDSFVNSIKNSTHNVPTFVGEFTCFALSDAWNYTLNSFNANGFHYTSWSYKVTGNSSWGIYNHNPDKVDIYNDSAETIRSKWSTVGANYAWKNTQIYNALKSKLPGTVTPFDKDISEYVGVQASGNGKYVCAENTGASPLVANRDSAQGWEQYKIVYNGDNTISLLSCANGKYLCAVIDENNQLLARSSKIDAWEKFYVNAVNDSEITLQAVANNKYVTVNANNSVLYADGENASAANAKFTIKNASDGSVYIPTNITPIEPSQPEETPNTPETAGSFETFKRVAYFPDWYGDVVNDVPFDKLTHINYAFGIPTVDGNIRDLGNKQVVNKLISTAHNNDVKVLIAVGGWSYNGVPLEDTFVQATNTDDKCQKLANSILSVVDTYGFDGVDIDWEYPRSNTSAQYEKFMAYLKQGLESRGKLLTAAVVGNGSTAYGQIDKVLNLLDWVNVMAYDGNAGSGHSPYSYAVECGEYWTKTRGLSKDKVVLGVPFYERPNWASYADIVANNSANAYKDSAVINGTTVYYNGINTMKDKTTWACNNAGGIMIWEITQDSKNADLSLLNAIYDTAKALLDKEVEVPDEPSEGSIRIEAENYSNMSGIQVEECAEGGQNVGYFDAGDWMEYNVSIPNRAEYTLKLRGAAQSVTGDVEVLYNDNVVDTITISSTGDWQAWKTFTGKNSIILEQGAQTLRFRAKDGGSNINWIELIYVKDIAEVAPNPEPTPEPEPEPEPEPTPEPDPVPGYAAYDSTKIYVAGDRVSYNGKVFEAKWWNLGEAPDETQQWGVWKVVTE